MNCPKYRFRSIHSSYGSFEDKTCVDIGCNDQWFGDQFKEAGGGKYVGIDNDPQHSSVLSIDKVDGQFDIGIYLNLHFAADYLDWVKKHCKTVFTSPRRGGNIEAEKVGYPNLLKKHFNKVELIWEGHLERIYKCE